MATTCVTPEVQTTEVEVPVEDKAVQVKKPGPAGGKGTCEIFWSRSSKDTKNIQAGLRIRGVLDTAPGASMCESTEPGNRPYTLARSLGQIPVASTVTTGDGRMRLH